jgi:carbon monoxide dehydrogenase subunit G
MLIENSFDVDADPDRVFDFLQNPHNVAACFPGAELTEDLGDDAYRGKVKIRLGPVTAAFTGTAKVVERDDAGRVAVLLAEGKDIRGSGTARARAAMRVEPAAGGGSSVLLQTDLTISGKLAQFGRGIMADVSTRMVGDLATRVRERIEGESAPVPAAEAEPGAETAAAETATSAEAGSAAATEAAGTPAEAGRVTAADRPTPSPAPAAGGAIKASAILKVMVTGVFRRLFDRLRGRTSEPKS